MASYMDSQKIRKGEVFKEGSENFLVLSHEHNKRGRGQATIRLKVKNIKTNVIVEKTYTNNDKLELADASKRSAQFLYSDDEKCYFMESNDYSQFDIAREDLSWELNFLKEGCKVVSLWVDDMPLSIELPGSVDLQIVNTEDAVAGDTSSGATKEIELETGFKLYGPLFLKKGNVVKINTETGSYVSKA